MLARFSSLFHKLARFWSLCHKLARFLSHYNKLARFSPFYYIEIVSISSLVYHMIPLNNLQNKSLSSFQTIKCCGPINVSL